MEPEIERSSPHRSSLWPLFLFGVVGFSWLASKFKAPHDHKAANVGVPQGNEWPECSRAQQKIKAEISFTPEVEQAKNAESKRDYKIQRQIRNATRAGVLAASIYAAITLLIWSETQTQTRIQRETAINAQRAWVGLDVPITLDAIAVDPRSSRVQIRGHYSIKNFGRGPAVKVMQSGDFLYNDPNQSADKRMLMTDREANFFCESAVKFATGTVPVSGNLKQAPPFGYTLFPDKSHDELIEYQGPIATLQFLQFVGCAAYIDQFRQVHWTRFCMWRRSGDKTPIPKLDFCSLYNDTDEPKRENQRWKIFGWVFAPNS